jgi:hypothetical protein
MKKVGMLVALITILMFTSMAWADQVKVAWDTYPNQTQIVGFRLYRSASPGVYVYGSGSANLVAQIATPSQVTYTIPNIPDGTYLVLTAYTATGAESGPSNEVRYVFVPGSPTGLVRIP